MKRLLEQVIFHSLLYLYCNKENMWAQFKEFDMLRLYPPEYCVELTGDLRYIFVTGENSGDKCLWEAVLDTRLTLTLNVFIDTIVWIIVLIITAEIFCGSC